MLFNNVYPSKLQSKSRRSFNFKRLLCLGAPQVHSEKGFGDYIVQQMEFSDHVNKTRTQHPEYCPLGMNGLEPSAQYVNKNIEMVAFANNIEKAPFYQNRVRVQRISTRQRRDIMDNIHQANGKMTPMFQNFTKHTTEYCNPVQQTKETLQHYEQTQGAKLANKCNCKINRRKGLTKAPNICHCFEAQEVLQGNGSPSCQQKDSAEAIFSPTDSTDINSNDLYNKLLAHFNNFCDEMLVRSGFVYKAARGKRLKIRKLMTQNNLINDVIKDKDTIANNFDVHYKNENARKVWASESTFAECLRGVVDKALFRRARSDHPGPHSGFPSRSMRKYYDPMSSVIVKVKCEHGVMKLEKLKSKGKKIPCSHFRSIPTQTLESALNPSYHGPKQRVNDNTLVRGHRRVPVDLHSFTTLPKSCFSSYITETPQTQPGTKTQTAQPGANTQPFRPETSTQIALTKQNMGSEFKIFLPEDYDTSLLQDAMHTNPIVAVLKTTKKQYFKESNNYYEITLKARACSHSTLD